MKRVLVIRSGAVGDLVLTLPVLSALKQRYAGLSIDMMGDPGRLSLLRHCGYVDNVLSIDSREFTPLFVPSGVCDALSGSVSQAAGPALRNLRSYDAILSYLPDPEGVFAGNLRRFASSAVLTGRSRPPDGCRIHMTRVLMDALKPVGVAPTAEPPEITLPSSAETEEVRVLALDSETEDVRSRPLSAVPENARSLPSDGNLVAIHPGSGGSAKCWLADRYAALIECLVERGYRPVVTFGPADDAVRRRILPRIKGCGALIAEGLPLLDMALLYARCRAMIGNDSGMTHLAATTGAPVIALFGPTDPAVWGPRGKEVRILWGTDVIDRDVDQLAWKEAFRPRSLADIEVNLVWQVLSQVRPHFGARSPAGAEDHK